MADEASENVDVAGLRNALFAGPNGLNVANLIPGKRPSIRRSRENLSSPNTIKEKEESVDTPNNKGTVNITAEKENINELENKEAFSKSTQNLSVVNLEDQNNGDNKSQEGEVLQSLCKRRVKRQGGRPPSRAFVRKSICLLDADIELLIGLEDENDVISNEAVAKPEYQVKNPIPVIEVSDSSKSTLVAQRINLDNQKTDVGDIKKSLNEKFNENKAAKDKVDVGYRKNQMADREYKKELEKKMSNITTRTPEKNGRKPDEFARTESPQTAISKNVIKQEKVADNSDIKNENISILKSGEAKTPLSKSTNKEFMKDIYMSKSALLSNREKITTPSTRRTPVVTRNGHGLATARRTNYETPQPVNSETSFSSMFKDRFKAKQATNQKTDRPTTSISERVLNRIRGRNEIEENKNKQSLTSRWSPWTKR